MPWTRSKYPDDWDEITLRVKQKAGWKCRICGRPHRKDIPDQVLTTHHRDGNPANCEESNLVAACARCHLRLEAELRKQKRREAMAREQASLPLL